LSQSLKVNVNIELKSLYFLTNLKIPLLLGAAEDVIVDGQMEEEIVEEVMDLVVIVFVVVVKEKEVLEYFF
jgi:hypothetical protein